MCPYYRVIAPLIIMNVVQSQICLSIPKVFKLMKVFNPLRTRNAIPDALANSEDTDETPYHAALHQGRHCLLRQNGSSEKEIPFYFNYNL